MLILGVNITRSLLLQVCRNAMTVQGTSFPGNSVCTTTGKNCLIKLTVIFHIGFSSLDKSFGESSVDLNLDLLH